MAKKKNSSKKSGILPGVARAISSVWHLISKIIGSAVRFVFRSSKDLDPEHQRDGIAFFLFILALLAASGTWFGLDNVLGRGIYAFIFGAVGVLAFITPLIFIYFAYRLFKSPDDPAAVGRITIGTILILVSTTSLAHIINGSVGRGATAIREGGGLIGYGVSTPLIALVTEI